MADEKTPGKGPTKVESKGADELEALGVNPQLDNRTGRQRPVMPDAIKPQQVHGGYPGDPETAEDESEDPPSKDITSAGDPLGFRAVGPHSRGEQSGPSSED